jgi:hypothetical protein
MHKQLNKYYNDSCKTDSVWQTGSYRIKEYLNDKFIKCIILKNAKESTIFLDSFIKTLKRRGCEKDLIKRIEFYFKLSKYYTRIYKN